MPTMRRSIVRLRGFTLIDLLVGLALAGITVAAAATVSVSIHQQMTRSQKQSRVDADAKQLSEYIVRHVRVLGGGAVRPHMAVSNRCETGGATLPSCGGAHPSPLRLLSLHPNAPQCPIVSFDASTQTVSFSSSGSCCFDSWSSTSEVETSYPVVQLPQNAGGGWRYRLCQPSSSTCACVLQPTAEGRLDLPPQTGVSAPAWVGGVVALGKPIHWRLDGETHQLVEESDDDGDGELDVTVLSPYIYGLGIAFGYDDDPSDGVVDLWQPNLDLAKSPRLRMIKFGLAVGTPAVGVPSTSVALFDGTLSSAPAGILLRSVFGATALRNVYVFQ